jgi:hypothetical protein
MAYAPQMGQDGGSRKSDLPDEASGIFLREGLDRLLVICRRANLSQALTVASGREAVHARRRHRSFVGWVSEA